MYKLLLSFTLLFLLFPITRGRATSPSHVARDCTTCHFNTTRHATTISLDGIPETNGYGASANETAVVDHVDLTDILVVSFHFQLLFTQSSGNDHSLLNLEAIILDSGSEWIDTTLRSCSKEGGSVAYISVRSPTCHVVNTSIQLVCSTCNGKNLRTWHSSLLLNCTTKLTNSSDKSEWSVVSSTIMYHTRSKVSESIVGDVIQTTLDLESDCYFPLTIRIANNAQCYSGYYKTYCTEAKFQGNPWDSENLLNPPVNSNLTAQDVAYVRLECHYDCRLPSHPEFFHLSPLVGRRIPTIQGKVITCPHRKVHISERENCRSLYDVQRNASKCVDGQCHNSNNSVNTTSASGLEPSLQNVANPTPDCYLEESSHTIICNRNPYLSCENVVALKQTEFAVFDNGSIYDHVTDDYLTDDEYVYINGTLFRCNVFVQNYTTFHRVWNYETLPILLSAVACAITSLCCFIIFVTYCLFSELRTLPGICTMCYVFSLGVTFLLVFGEFEAVDIMWLCTLLGFLLHYFALSHFTWSSVIAINLLRSFVIVSKTSPRPVTINRRKTIKQIVLYNIIGWGIPLLVCVTCLVLDKGTNVNIDYATDKLCYLQEKVAVLVGFIMPVCIIVLFNLVTFIVLVVSIHRTIKATKMATSNSRDSNTKKKLRIYAGIFSLLGLTWILALMASIKDLDVLWYLFFVITLLHGPTLLVMFVLNKRTRHLYISMFERLSTSKSDDREKKDGNRPKRKEGMEV